MSDSDDDGLSDTEEGLWCTNPDVADTDTDSSTDGEEIDALLAGDRSEGPPFEWHWENDESAAGPTPWGTVCYDSDFDSVPDGAEILQIGLKTVDFDDNAESTDGDKFDDGQELFGSTKPTRGDLPVDWGIGSPLPEWVEPPGDHPLVAAFPVIEISVVPGSWTVERVTEIQTAEGQMTQTTNTYETSVTEGTSTSIADTVTWNRWEEVSESVETPIAQGQNVSISSSELLRDYASVKIYTGTGAAALGLIAGAGCVVLTAGTCAIALLAGGLVAGAGASWALSGIDDLVNLKADELSTQELTTKYSSEILQCSSPQTNVCTAPEFIDLNQAYDFQNLGNSLEGLHYSIGQQNELLARGLHDISYAISQPRYTETRTNGQSWGGAQTVTNEVYEEHTITEGEAFTTGQNWSTAWAVDSSHAADLTFNYIIANEGTEYAREIEGVIFNIYLGDDSDPIKSYPAWEQFQTANWKMFSLETLSILLPIPFL